ncbi:hypothetical protein [Sinorhizobium fredii]|uniref:hypothetical protein n=1 Tax=Rhizobium fredii TaxID=380 RepID=UPI0012FE1842|nr:hypothetical protein [Sinorhizobium fredii]
MTQTTGSKTRHERQKARPGVDDLTDPKEVWKDAETTPQRDTVVGGAKMSRQRVADAGDIKSGEPSPYDIEVQADSIAKQTDRRSQPKRKK